MAQQDIQSVLQEDRIFPPSAQFRKKANLKAADFTAMYDKAARDYVGFWADLAIAEIEWHQPFTVPLDDSRSPNYRWFIDGTLNVSHNCLDVHLATRGNKLAIIFEGEPGDVRTLTYAELHAEVCRFANALKAAGIERGRPCRHLYAADSRGGDLHAGLRADRRSPLGGLRRIFVQCREGPHRRRRSQARDHRGRRLARWRQTIELKRAVDKALADGCPTVRNVIVYGRTGSDCDMLAGRDLWWRDVISGQSATCEPRMGGCGTSPVSALYLRLNRQTQGHPACKRGISAQCQNEYAVGVRPERHGYFLVYRRRRLGSPGIPTSRTGPWRPAQRF